jgi:hypothetical protein
MYSYVSEKEDNGDVFMCDQVKYEENRREDNFLSLDTKSCDASKETEKKVSRFDFITPA